MIWRTIPSGGANSTISPDRLSDDALGKTWDMNHLRVQEKGRYIMQPGEVFYIWIVIADDYKYQMTYFDDSGARQTAYVMELVQEEDLVDSKRLAEWEAFGYRNLNRNAVGKEIYHTDCKDTESPAYPYLTAEGDYSRYNENQLEIIKGLLRDILNIRYNGTTFVTDDAGAEAFTMVYDELSDTVTLITLSGRAWSIAGLYVNGQSLPFTVNGERLIFSYSFYTDRY